MRHVVALSSGEAAGIEDDQLTLRDPAGRVVARYSHAGGLRVEVPDGDLILAAPRGRVVLEGEIIDMKSRRWNTHAQRATMTAGRWELRADRAVERFDEALSHVQGRVAGACRAHAPSGGPRLRPHRGADLDRLR